MGMLRYFTGDDHELCFVVIKLKHASSCPNFDITYAYFHCIK